MGEIDIDQSGKITVQEFDAACSKRRVQLTLEKMNLTRKDMDELWEILDDGDGELDSDEFISGVLRLSGEAKSKEMMQLSKEIADLEASVEFMEESMGVSGKRIQDMRGLLGRTRKDIVALSRERTNQRERKRHQDQVSRCVRVPPLPAGRHHPCNGRHDWWQAFSTMTPMLAMTARATRP